MRRRNYSKKHYNRHYNYNRYKIPSYFFNRVIYRPQVTIDIPDEVVYSYQFILEKGVLPRQFQCECGEVNNFLLLFTNEAEYIKTIIKLGYRYTDMNDNIACVKCGKVYNFSNIRKTINKTHILLNNK